MLRRRGFTAVELIVSMTIGGVVLAMIASVSAREQRVFADLADRASVGAQLRDASSVLPIDLRSLAPRLGDIRDARDTALEIRATIAGGVVCDSSAAAIILAPSTSGASTYSGATSPIEAGDTLWLAGVSDTLQWAPLAVLSTSTGAAGPCAARGPKLDDSARVVPRVALTLSSMPPAVTGMPVRITRPVRYSIYRASDGLWYLGEKDWSNASGRFNTIQPVAGPLLAPNAGGLVFRYMDALGVALPTPVVARESISLIRIELRGQTTSPVRALGSASINGKRTDSAIVSVALRNAK